MPEFYIIACPSCNIKYKVNPLKLKPGVKVRCKKCQTVFTIPSRAPEKKTLEQKKPETTPFPPSAPPEQKVERKPPPVPPPKPPEEKIVERKPPPAPQTEEEKKLYKKAERLARILAKDIINYYHDKWERALKQENIKEVLRGEIEKSYKYYCEKIPPEIRQKTNFFKEAFNRIVGKGQDIFS